MRFKFKKNTSEKKKEKKKWAERVVVVKIGKKSSKLKICAKTSFFLLKKEKSVEMRAKFTPPYNKNMRFGIDSI